MVFKKLFQIIWLVLCSVVVLSGCNENNTSQAGTDITQQTIKAKKVLIFSKTTGYRHGSIETGVRQLSKLLSDNEIQVVATENADIFNDKQLAEFSALIFLNTTGDILNEQQQVAMERYIQAGGGFVGIHAAADTEWKGDWYWYRRLVGGVFKSHPNVPSNVQAAELNVINHQHAATEKLPSQFDYVDEWYDYKDLSKLRHDLMTIDESSYHGGAHGDYHPIAWYQYFDGGRSFYTGIGHTAENFSNPLYLNHILGGVIFAIGDNKPLNYALSRPEPNRFVKKTLLEGLAEPVSLTMTKAGDAVVFIQRRGQVFWFDIHSEKLEMLDEIPVLHTREFGLIGLALDPNFELNHHLYLMYNTEDPDRKADLLQRVSRFTLVDKKIDLSSEKILLSIATDDTCCHTGGNIEFNQQGELFIAIGDNTNPFNSNGIGPANNKPNEKANDALRTSGNSQDLRGKILRITPTEDGQYTIPEGNLFTDASKGRPEIYVMGTRNPYTISYDEAEQILYYGDVGPDAKADTDDRGPRGYDEINRVKTAGYFGWPLFIGNNQAYRDYDEVNDKVGKWFNPLKPMNNSPRNTGVQFLPAAQPALIWYPYAPSDEFKELGSGSRNALVAGVYRTPKTITSESYPSYYEGKLFISDFMRRWIKVVSMTDEGKISKIDSFAPQVELAAPLDLTFSPQGELWILEYGSKWFSANPDARLSKIAYLGDGNRSPTAKIKLNQDKGAAPLVVKLDASSSMDPDNDVLQYQWQLHKLADNETLESVPFKQTEVFSEAKITETQINEVGRYALILHLDDGQGAKNSAKRLIEVGNAPPSISIEVSGNQSFIWPNSNPKTYQISVTDLEDGSVKNGGINANDVYVSFNATAGEQAKLGHQTADPIDLGKAAVKKYNCLGCHQLDAPSIGPSYREVADKYADQTQAVETVSQIIASGSTGQWGNHQMPAHDFLDDNIRKQLALYILSLKTPSASLPLTGELTAKQANQYVLKAEYTDKGANGLAGNYAKAELAFVSPIFPASYFVHHKGNMNGVVLKDDNSVQLLGNKTALHLDSFDLSNVKAVKLSQKNAKIFNRKAKFELRMGSANGELIAQAGFNYDKVDKQGLVYVTLNIKPINKPVDLYLVVSMDEADDNFYAGQLVQVEFVQK